MMRAVRGFAGWSPAVNPFSGVAVRVNSAPRVVMTIQRVSLRSALFFGICLSLIGVPKVYGQAQPHVMDVVDDARRVTSSGNVHPLARAEFDHGAVADS